MTPENPAIISSDLDTGPFSEIIDFAEAERYLATLCGSDWETKTYVFQSYDDNRDRQQTSNDTARKLGHARKDPYAKMLQGTWREHQQALADLNRSGAGIYLTVNESAGGRKVEHLKKIRAVWIEWDDRRSLPAWPAPPHLLVESSPQKYHVYWATEGMTAPEHQRVMAGLAGSLGSSADAADPVRVLRMPGFFHQRVDTKKGFNGEPFRVRLLTAENREILPPYTTDFLLEAFKIEAWEKSQAKPEEAKSKPAKNKKKIVTPINKTDVKDALTFLSPNDEQTWRIVGVAMSSTNQPAAWELWDEWSRKGQDFSPERQEKMRREIQIEANEGGQHPPITLETLYALARAKRWRPTQNWKQGLGTDKAGIPVDCQSNISLILRNADSPWKDQLRYNTFTRNIEYGDSELDTIGRIKSDKRWRDEDDSDLSNWLLAEYKMTVKTLNHCTQAAYDIAVKNSYHPITTWINGLQWDEIERLPSFFEDYCGTARSEYLAYCGLSLFLSLVARADKPGCQVDTMVVLQGRESLRKTTLCRVIGGPWYKGITLSFDSKDIYTSLRTAWVGELVELGSLVSSTMERFKALCTQTDDYYRPAYGRNEVHQLRNTVFIGTTNDSHFISDPFGGRRFLPVSVGEIQLEQVEAVLPQLFAEAYVRYKRGETWWKQSQIVTDEAQEMREAAREVDPWEETIREYLIAHPGEPISRPMLLGDTCLKIPIERWSTLASRRISRIMQRLGYKNTTARTQQFDEEGKEIIARRYIKKDLDSPI